jgi:hypothetical protein
MKDKYMLEIYYPTGTSNVMAYFTSDTPFQAISQGDIINADSLPDADKALDLRVTSIEHILWTLENGESKHKVCVYTEGADGSDRR